MIVFPNCKINLGLRILRKREDGYHDLETIFYPIPVYDVLEVLPLENEKNGTVKFQQTGIYIEGETEKNLCVRAYRLMQKRIPDLPAVYLHLQKNIPTGAGLGGGSADGAFTLLALQSIFKLSIPNEEIAAMALQLGSDCPFFLVQKAALGEKRGEKLTPLSTSLSDYQILLIHPGFSISTAEAFEGVKPNSEGMQLSTLISQPVEKWKDVLHNQFEETIFLKFPALGKLKNNLYNAGAIYAAMSGSGSTIFGIFPPEANRPSMGDYSWMQWRKFP